MDLTVEEAFVHRLDNTTLTLFIIFNVSTLT